MANDGKLYIVITDRRPEQLNQEEDGNGDKEKKQKTIGDYAKHRFFDLVKEQSKQVVNNTIGNIGNFTGDFQTQQQITEAVNYGNTLKSLAMSAYAGFKMTGGNPIGAIVAVGFSIASQGINFLLEERANKFANYKQNYQIEKMRDLSGLNGLTNGGRI